MATKTVSFSTTVAGAPLTATVEVAPLAGAVTRAQESFARALLRRFMDISAEYVPGTAETAHTAEHAPAAPKLADDPATAVATLAAAAEAIADEPAHAADYHLLRRAEALAGTSTCPPRASCCGSTRRTRTGWPPPAKRTARA
ncbi:hypothetical protein JKI95_04180 [Corynebacterium aquatimens]|uniref:hypothetical protein n=1 Tax=Corynebacterium aquatimens TaxID=1190508 RepID=UPI00254092EE|nr:hypothetical protein [Corynebacterium aquatimens]QYH20162.1 hypothetical protein JKI95_04180 [Corynebacterium aquatimens]